MYDDCGIKKELKKSFGKNWVYNSEIENVDQQKLADIKLVWFDSNIDQIDIKQYDNKFPLEVVMSSKNSQFVSIIAMHTC